MLMDIDKKSLFRRHGHPPAGTGLNERFHGGNVAESGRWRQVRLQTRIERIQGAGKTAEMQLIRNRFSGARAPARWNRSE